MKKQERTDIVARADDAYGSSNYAEYVVEKKIEGSYKMQRILMKLGYAAIFLLIIGLVALINSLTGGMGIVIIPMFCLAPLAAWILYFFTWRFVSVEYAYTVDHSYLTVEKVLGGKNKVELFKCKVKDIQTIAPYTEEAKEKLRQFNADKTIEAVSSMSASDIYYAAYESETGSKTVVFFQATEQALKALKYYNSSAVIMSKVSR